MRPSFNTAGPCVEGEHYMLPPGDRVKRALELVDDGKFFSLVAGHQTGKTTCARWMVAQYNRGDRYRALWVDLQTARDTPDPALAMPVVLDKVWDVTRRTLPGLLDGVELPGLLAVPGTALLHVIRAIAARSALPLVIFFDEADGLVGAAMVSFLSQLRDGYLDRATTRSADHVERGRAGAACRDRSEAAARHGDRRRGAGTGAGVPGVARGAGGVAGDVRPALDGAVERAAFRPRVRGGRECGARRGVLTRG